MAGDASRPFPLPAWAWSIGLVALTYLLTVVILPGSGLWINDNGAKLIQTQGIVINHYRDFSVPWPGAASDPSFHYNPVPYPIGAMENGRLHITYSPAFALASSLPWRAFGTRGLFIMPWISGILLLPAVWILAGFASPSPSARPLAVLIAGLGTPLWFYSMTFWEHAPAACLAAWAAAFMFRHLTKGTMRPLAASAALCGLSIYLRADMLVFAAAIIAVMLIYGSAQRRGAVIFLAALALAVLPLAVGQWLMLGHPLGLHLAAHSPFSHGLAAFLAERWAVLQKLWLNAHPNPWLSAVAAGPFVALFLVFPRVKEERFNRAAALLAAAGIACAMIVAGGLLSSESPYWWLVDANGLFAASPALILAFIRVRRSPADAVAAADGPLQGRGPEAVRMIALLFALGYAALSPTSSFGVHWGCRFLLPAYPLLAVLAAGTAAGMMEAGTGRGKRTGAAAVALVLALSFAAQLYSIYLLYERKAYSVRLNRAVMERGENVVVATDWFIPQILAPVFYDKEIFLAPDRGGRDELMRELRREGVGRVLMIAASDAGIPDKVPRTMLDDGMKFMTLRLADITLAP